MPKLTQKAVKAARPRLGRDVTTWDSTLRGFGLRVWPSGLKVFVIQYRNPQGRLRRLTVGELGRLTLDEARHEARLLLGEVEKGGDPLQNRQKIRQGETVEQLAGFYLESHVQVKCKPSTIKEFGRLIRKRIVPALGRRKVAELSRADAAKLHHSMRNIPTEANRTLALLKAILNMAERWGLRPQSSNPCKYIEKYPESRRERFLTAEEVGRLGDALAEAEATRSEMPGLVLAVRLLALTGMRRSEVLGLRWAYVDVQRFCFFLPDSKTGRKTVPVGPPVLELLARAPRFPGNPFVCPGFNSGGPVVGIDKSWRRLTKRAGLEGVRIHDLRHSWASFGAAAGLGLYVVGKVLGHSSPATTARYAHLADDPLRVAASRVSNEIASALNRRPPSGEVIEFPRK